MKEMVQSLNGVPIFAVCSVSGIEFLLVSLLFAAGTFITGMINLLLIPTRLQTKQSARINNGLLVLQFLPYLLVFGFNLNLEPLVYFLGLNNEFVLGADVMVVTFLLGIVQFSYLKSQRPVRVD